VDIREHSEAVLHADPTDCSKERAREDAGQTPVKNKPDATIPTNSLASAGTLRGRIPQRASWADMCSDSESESSLDQQKLEPGESSSAELRRVQEFLPGTVEKEDDTIEWPGDQVHPGDVMSAFQWAEEMNKVAKRMSFLAGVAPSFSTSQQLVATDMNGDDLNDLEHCAAQTRAQELEISSLKEQLVAAAMEANTIERNSSAAFERVATNNSLAAGCARHKLEQHVFLMSEARAADDAATEAHAALLTARKEAEDCAHARTHLLAALRSSVIERTAAANAAEEELEAATAAQQSIRELPAAEERRRMCEAESVQLRKENEKMRMALEQVQAEITASSQKAAARADVLEARISQISSECRTAQNSYSTKECDLHENKSGAEVQISQMVEADLHIAQERSRVLVLEVKGSRAARDKAAENVEELQSAIASAEIQVASLRAKCVDLDMQLNDIADGSSKVQKIVEDREEEVEALEQHLHSQEKLTEDMQKRIEKVEMKLLELKSRTRSAEKEATSREFRLKTVLDRLRKEAVKAYPPARPSLRHRGSSATDVDVQDAEVSTTAGDSMTEGFPEC